jgi:hypothetical protein
MRPPPPLAPSGNTSSTENLEQSGKVGKSPQADKYKLAKNLNIPTILLKAYRV